MIFKKWRRYKGEDSEGFLCAVLKLIDDLEGNDISRNLLGNLQVKLLNTAALANPSCMEFRIKNICLESV